MYRRLLLCIAAVLILPFVRPSLATQPQVIDDRGDATPPQDVHYAIFETIEDPVSGRALQVTLGLPQWPHPEEGGTYSVAFDYGDCGGGRVVYNWLGGGQLSGFNLGRARTAANATFWSCHPVVNAAGQTAYTYESQDISVTWIPEGLQWRLPLSHGLAAGIRLTNTQACTGQTVLGATHDVRRRSGIDCSSDRSPIGADYVIGSA